MSNFSHDYLPAEHEVLKIWRGFDPSLKRVTFSYIKKIYELQRQYIDENPANISAQKNPPSHQLFNENEGPGKKWLPLGVAWRQKKNPDGFVIKLDIVPSSGRILMFGTSR